MPNQIENNEFRRYNLSDVIIKSPYKKDSTQEATQKIVLDFNQNRPSIMTSGLNWLFMHRLVKADEFRLVEKNGIPELVPSTATPLRRQKIFNFQDTSSTIGIFKQSERVIGHNGHYIINVPPGCYAKIFDGRKAKLLDSGQHVIHSNNFRFDPERDIVSVNSPYIQHNNLHILRVPPGKVAIVNIDNCSYFLESRKEPYVFKTLQFNLQRATERDLFYDARSKMLQAGTQIRLIPDVGEIGIINKGGRFEIAEPAHDQTGPMFKDIGNARFDGFLSLNLQNVDFPSKSTRDEHIENGVAAKDANYDFFYTADSIKVGVRFFVSYKIIDPMKTLESLSLKDISKHIEGLVNSDMGNAIKQTSMQDLLSSDLSKPLDLNSSAAGNGFKHWQDRVKTKLKEDLNDYGIDLIRLNIEEAKIIDPVIEEQMSQQAVTITKANAQKAALQVTLDVNKAEAAQQRELALLQQGTETELITQKAQAKVNAAKLEAQAASIKNETEVELQMRQAKVLASSPEAMLIAFLNKFVEALQKGHFSSALPLSDLSQMMAACMNKIMEVVKPANEGGNAASAGKSMHSFYQKGDANQSVTSANLNLTSPKTDLVM